MKTLGMIIQVTSSQTSTWLDQHLYTFLKDACYIYIYSALNSQSLGSHSSQWIHDKSHGGEEKPLSYLPTRHYFHIRNT